MIAIENLNKYYNRLHVLKDVSTTLEKEKVTVIIGPNGSGKSTLIKSILGLVKPTSGSIYVNDNLVNGNHLYRRDLGYIPQYGHFPNHLTVSDVMKFVINIRNDAAAYDHTRMPFDLKAENKKRINTLSGGTRQKLSANIAFMFNALIYICDEPTAGLDPIANQKFKQHIRKLKEEGKTIIISSHVISEVDEIADNIVFLCDGHLKYDGSIELLKEQTGQSNLENAVIKLMEQPS